MSPTTAEALRTAVEDAARSLAPDGARPKARPTLERPKKAEFGDFSTNAAMLYAPLVKAPPRNVAERLGRALSGALGAGLLEKVEVAGPGFLNLWLSDAWHLGALREVLAAGERFGAGGAARAERVNVEFVSSNPTGPVHIGHARGAAYGDALCRILAFHGHEVHREFYVNDAGSQIDKFTESIRARARGEEVPEGGYRGDYVRELAELLPDGPDLGERAVAEMVRRMRETLERFRVAPFGTWFSERTLHDGSPSAVDRAFARLEEQGRLYRSEGALWLRTSDLGDDKDRVLVRSSGDHTYFASDIAYHWDKHERGHERLIDVWGADHHGYVPRMKVMWQALGEDPDALELLIMQFVHLVSGGQRASMSKRAGEFVTLDDLVAEIGVDAARWFLLNRSHDTTIDLDLELAVSESKQNPVYYVQYAHARIASLLARAEAEGAGAEPPADAPLEPEERALVQRLLAFPAEVAEAADRRAPHRIATYALELAQAFTAFYDRHPVLKAGEPVRSARLALCVATRQVVAEALGLLGVSAPDSM